MQDPVLTPIFTAALVTAGLPSTGAAVTVAGIGITTAQIASTLAAATLLAGSVALNYAMQPDAPKPEQGSTPLKQTIPPRIVGFGEVRLAGNYGLFEVVGGHSFDVLALCQGPCGGFKQVYLDDKKVTINTITGQAVTVFPDTTLAYRACTVAATKGPKLNTAFAMPQLAAVWTADHRGDRMVTLLLISQGVQQQDFLKLYPHGLPKPSAALFLPCWDFRDEAQDPDDPDTWVDYAAYNALTTYNAGDRVLHGGVVLPGVAVAGGMLWLCLADGTLGVTPVAGQANWAPVWKNPVLQAVTYLTNSDIGMGLPREVLISPVLDELTVQAALCDAPQARGDGLYEPRYASNPWFKMETEPTQVLGQILGACDGWVSLNGEGALSLKVGTFEAPTVTLGEDIITGVELAYGVEDEDKVDELTLSFTSPDLDYTSQSISPWRDEAAILNRGGKVRSQAFGPASVQSPSQVWRLAKRIYLRANARRGVIETHLGGMVAAGHRFVVIDYPLIPELDGAVVELRRRETDLSSRKCRFEFVEVDPDLLDGWVPAEEEGEAIPEPDAVAPESLPVPDNVEAVVVDDGATLYRIDLSWDDPDRDDIGYRVRYRQTNVETDGIPGAWSQEDFFAPLIDGGRVSVSIFPTEDIELQIQVASLGASGTISEWSDSTYISTAFPALDYSRPMNSAKWLFANAF